jgi:type II secretory pathway pseudopilin PulG
MKTDTKNMITGFITPPAYIPMREARSGSPAGRQAGLTLVEVVIAAALLILSLAAFTTSFVQSRRSAAIADNRLEAIHVARQQMETICSSNYTALSVGTCVFSSGVYTGSYTVSSNTTARVKDIVVTINWVNPLGKATSTVSLASSVSAELHQ